jgi:hypothetical protein
MSNYKVNDKELTINLASFATALELKNAVIRAITERKLSASSTILDSLNSQTELTPEMLDSILQAVLAVASSTEVERLLMECAKLAFIGTDKINADYFEKAEHRKDYYPIMFHLLKENLEPFFAGAFSLFPNLEKAKTANSQK